MLIIHIRARTDLSVDVSISTQMSIGRQFTTGLTVHKRPMTVNRQSLPWSQKCFPGGQEMQLVDTRIADRTITTIQVISCAATIIVIGLILNMVGVSIYEIFVTTH
jgi:hypothetical protein